jgi:hypothetical protein
MNILKPLLLGVFVLTLCATANAQTKKSTTEKVLTTTGKATVIIVGQSARIAYQTAKFTGKEFVKPAVTNLAKPLILKVIPKTTVFLIKKGIPIGKKLFVTYLKTRLSL